MHVDRRLLGWGAFFVLLGAIPLAVRANLLDEEIVRRWWQLWPLILVGWGVSLLLRRTPVDWLGGAITAITFGVMGGSLIATGTGTFPSMSCNDQLSTQPFTAQSGTLSGGGRVNVTFDCGRVRVVTAGGSDWKVEGTATDGRGPIVDASGSRVTVRPPDRGEFLGNARRNDWTVTVPQGQDVEFGMTLNAGEGTADLASAKIGSANLTVNAGSMRLLLGQAASLGSVNTTVNAGSATISLPAYNGSANISVNAGSLDLCIPADLAVRVHFNGGLGSQNLDSLGFTKVDQNTWVSQGYDSASTRAQMNVSANLGSFALHLGGGCGA